MRRILPAILVAALAAPATAQAIPSRNSARTPSNAAGVVYHPNGDFFEIWDNVRDGKSVVVKWNYVGIDDRWKTVKSHARHAFYQRAIAEPRWIYFRIYGWAPGPILERSAIVKWRTYGSG
jgi:hypothetical protein